jgi:hypothetical protein
MTKNIIYCNRDFLPEFKYYAASFYNHFNCLEQTQQLLDEIGSHPKCKINFEYNAEKRIRATFITFEDAAEDLEVFCIALLFFGERHKYRCYFYEVYDDGAIHCVEVGNGRVVRYLNAGKDTNTYFEKLCANVDYPNTETVAMVFYKEEDDTWRILDIDLCDLDMRSRRLLGTSPVRRCKTVGGKAYIFYSTPNGDCYLAARTEDGETLQNVGLSDIANLKNYP